MIIRWYSTQATGSLDDNDAEDRAYARLTDKQLEAEIIAKHREQARQILRDGPADTWKTRVLISVDRKEMK